MKQSKKDSRSSKKSSYSFSNERMETASKHQPSKRLKTSQKFKPGAK